MFGRRILMVHTKNQIFTISVSVFYAMFLKFSFADWGPIFLEEVLCFEYNAGTFDTLTADKPVSVQIIVVLFLCFNNVW